jgi:protoporphyrinogen/coproporphyrinogen III oxidase
VTRHVPALVVGGGISGLVCAYTLRKAGIDAELIEASARPGGVIQSFTRDGFLLELGPQSFSGTAALHQLCDELGISDQIVQAPSRAPRYVLVAGRLQPVPLTPPAFFTSGLIGGATKWALLRDIFGNTVPPDSDESVASFVRRKFSSQLLDRLVGPFVSGVYAGDPEHLSVRSAFPQLYEAEKTSGSIVRGMTRLAKSRKGPRENPTLQSFRDGNETLVRALSRKIGPAMRMRESVIGISRQENGAFDVRLNGEGNSQPVSARALIFATPTDVTGNLLGQLHAAFEPLLATVEYASVGVVSLGYRKSDVGHALDGFGFLVPRSAGLRVLGTVWNSSLFPGRAPQGHALLTGFVGGTTDPSAAILKPEELATLVHREISPLLSIKSEPIFSNVKIWPRALPQYNLGHADRLTAISKLLQDFPGIWLAGNYLHGPAVGSCVEQAITVAEEVRQGLNS